MPTSDWPRYIEDIRQLRHDKDALAQRVAKVEERLLRLETELQLRASATTDPELQ